MSLPELAPGDVHLWFAFEEEITAQDLHAEYRALLTAGERAKELRFRTEAGRRQYLVTRALVRTVLSHYQPVPPETWRFTNDPYGRPYITAPDVPVPAFNLSHTAGLVVCAVTRQPCVGVDVERLQDPDRPLALAERFFSSAEAADLRSLPPDEQPGRFLEYWTLKESYIKARGFGLSLPLKDFSFSFVGSGGLTLSLADKAESAAWKFWLLQPSARHVAAVCITGATSHRLSVCRCVPLRSAEPFMCAVSRES